MPIDFVPVSFVQIEFVPVYFVPIDFVSVYFAPIDFVSIYFVAIYRLCSSILWRFIFCANLFCGDLSFVPR